MRLLAGRIERVAIRRRVVVAEIGARLHRIGRKPAVLEVQFDDLGGGGQRGFGLVAMPALDLEHQIAAEFRMHQRRAGGDGVARARHRGQRLIVDRDGFSGILGRKARLRDHRSDDIADVMDLVAGKGRARRAVHRAPVAERHGMHDGELAMPRLVPVVRRQRQAARPALRRRRLVAIERIRAWACGLRTKMHQAVPVAWTSST